MKFKTAEGDFDVERFKSAVRIFITAQEIIVDNASYPVKEIAENSHIFRTLGLGYANLGSLIMSYGFGYDSIEGRALCGAITAIMTGEAYEQSARLARAIGPFPGYRDARASGVPKPVAKDNLASMLEVIELHRDAVREISDAEIVARCIYALVNEGAYILEEGIALRASDIDMVYLTGYGFPLHRGGPMCYADTVGLFNVVQAMKRFAKNPRDDASFWQPAPQHSWLVKT